jgi:hypothetical protein
MATQKSLAIGIRLKEHCPTCGVVPSVCPLQRTGLRSEGYAQLWQVARYARRQKLTTTWTYEKGRTSQLEVFCGKGVVPPSDKAGGRFVFFRIGNSNR